MTKIKNLRRKEEVEHNLNSMEVEKRFTKAIICLIAIVLGALVLAGLYAIIDGEVMPALSEKITEMFNYSN